MTITKNLELIREYTRKHPALLQAHHFGYDLRLNPRCTRVDFIVFGINPGEVENDWTFAPKTNSMPLEETSEKDFHNNTESRLRYPRWRRLAEEISQSRNVIIGNHFFWSSSDTEQLERRYGHLRYSAHFEFCIKLNKDLVRLTCSRAIICPGLKTISVVAEAHDLKPRGEIAKNVRGDRIVVPYHDGQRYWLFTKHWSGARLSNSEKKIIQDQVKTFSEVEA